MWMGSEHKIFSITQSKYPLQTLMSVKSMELVQIITCSVWTHQEPSSALVTKVTLWKMGNVSRKLQVSKYSSSTLILALKAVCFTVLSIGQKLSHALFVWKVRIGTQVIRNKATFSFFCMESVDSDFVDTTVCNKYIYELLEDPISNL